MLTRRYGSSQGIILRLYMQVESQSINLYMRFEGERHCGLARANDQRIPPGFFSEVNERVAD